jgi:hypothetical protein
LLSAGPRKGQRACEPRSRHGAGRDHEHVVPDLRALARAEDACVGVDRGERAEGEARGRGLGYRGELDVVDGAGVERLRDGERAVPERGLGCEQLEVDEIACERAQRKQRLEPGHAAAGDQHAETAVCLRVFGLRHGTTVLPLSRCCHR